MPKWQDFLLARGRYHKYQLDFAKKSKIDWGAKILCHFFWFQFLGSAGPKIGRIQKNGWQNFSTIIVLVWGQSWKKIAYIILPEYFIFSFSYKTPYLGQKGPPCPTGGVRGEIWPLMGFLFTGHSYKPIKSKTKNFFWPVRACIYVRSSVKLSFRSVERYLFECR